MNTKILTALAALTLFTAASARTLEHYLDTGSGEGGSGSITAQVGPFEGAFTAALTHRFQRNANHADVVFQARAPRTFSVSAMNVSVHAITLTTPLQASTEVWWQARRPMKLSSKSM